MRQATLILFLLLGHFALQAQETWDLEKCIRYAQENSLLIKQNAINVENNKLDLTLAKRSRLPTADATLSQSLNFGRSIDPTTNTFQQQTIYANGYGISGGVPIYNGGRINHSIDQTEVSVRAAEEDLANVQNNLALNVAQAYLNVLLAEEAILALQEQQKQTENQMANTRKMIAAGTLPANTIFDLEAQLARNEQNIVNGQNAIDLAYLSLKQIMNFDPYTPILISKPNINVLETAEVISAEAIYSLAEQNQPNIRANELREESARINVEVAQSALKPQINGFYQFQTNYSSLGKEVTGFTPVQQNLGDVEIPNVGTFPLLITTQAPTLRNTPYFNQLGDNFRQAVGVSLSVPIYNGDRNKIQIERAKLGVVSAEIASEQSKVQLKADINQAIANARAALKRYNAALKTVNALEQALGNTRKRFDAGAASAFELTTAENSLLVSRAELIQSKYDYIFRLKILDFYEGKPIVLE